MNSEIYQIPIEEVQFHPLSHGDPSGRLFWWKGELYRGIRSDSSNFFRRLFNDGIIQTLVDKELLVSSELTALQLDSYDLVIKHRKLPTVSYDFEWGAPMLKAAALLTIDLEMELNKYGLALKDAHTANVIFDNWQPLFVDLGSIIPFRATCTWRSNNQFYRFFIHPLELMSAGRERTARLLMRGNEGIDITSLDGINLRHYIDSCLKYLIDSRASRIGPKASHAIVRRLSLRQKQKIKQALSKLLSLRPVLKLSISSRSVEIPKVLEDSAIVNLPSPVSQEHIRRLLQLQETVQQLKPQRQKTEWSDYYASEFPAFQPCPEWTCKHYSVYETLSRLKPRTVLDIGSAGGWYSQLAANMGSRVVAVDVDEGCIANLWQDARIKNLPILPLIMSFTDPSPGYGLQNQQFAPATERFEGELILALAVVHHLVYRYYLTFDQVVDGFLSFQHKHLIVEFVPCEDEHVKNWDMSNYPWYNLENFKRALESRYSKVTRLPSEPEPRILLLCER